MFTLQAKVTKIWFFFFCAYIWFFWWLSEQLKWHQISFWFFFFFTFIWVSKWGHALGFCEASKDNLSCNRCYINKFYWIGWTRIRSWCFPVQLLCPILSVFDITVMRLMSQLFFFPFLQSSPYLIFFMDLSVSSLHNHRKYVLRTVYVFLHTWVTSKQF